MVGATPPDSKSKDKRMEVTWFTSALCTLMVVTPFLFMRLWALFDMLWLTPLRTRRNFGRQGIPCLPYRFLYGNFPELTSIRKEAQLQPMPRISHDILSRALPHYHRWTEKYGDKFVYWQGSQARIFVTNLEDIKEVLSTKFTQYQKLPPRPDMLDLVDNAIILLDGERWALHRRILNPGFFLEKLKAMVPTMATCTFELLERWESPTGKSVEVDVTKGLIELSADIIAHTAFGTSYKEGKKIFDLQQEQIHLAERINSTVYIPGRRFLPTAFNRLCRRVDKELEGVICQMIESRLRSSQVDGGDLYGNDLLGLLLSSMTSVGMEDPKKRSLGITEVMGECKTFFLAGHETSVVVLSWTLLLLAVHDEWQERLRTEVQAVCGASNVPTADALSNLKLVNMVLNETLRLYPPVPVLSRKTCSDMQLGKMTVPSETVIMVPVLALHHDERYWGPDANEFRPERFSEGVAKACRVPGVFLPFGTGPRVCIGQVFALFEVKAVVATLLQRFRIRLSPGYKHSPVSGLALRPMFGVPLLFEPL